MDLPKIILVPTDFTSYAQEALDYALKLAKQLDARVCIVHAYLMPVAGWEGAWAFPGDVITQLEADSRAKLDATLKKARETLPSTTATFYDGDPRDGVLKAALDLKADLIVMGTHGRRGLSRAIMGSVTEFVLRHASCPVLAVHHPKEVV
jgi:nucleotide-binding universal stress UspA family protein